MGEAKRRRLMSQHEFDRLSAAFAQHGVDTSLFGFYDQKAFLEREQRDPTFLEEYAKWVTRRPRDDGYEQHVHDVVPRLTELLAGVLKADGFEGGCVAASGMMTRMLDRLGVWSFATIGSLVLQVDKNDLWRGLQIADDLDFPDAIAGHSWVVAPPYRIVDSSIALQRWIDDPMGEYVPPYFLVEAEGAMIRPTVEDVVSDRVRARYFEQEGHLDPDLHYRLETRLRTFGRDFPAWGVTVGDLQLRYIPSAIRMTDVPLELINIEGRVGRPAIEIWTKDVAPVFGSILGSVAQS